MTHAASGVTLEAAFGIHYGVSRLAMVVNQKLIQDLIKA